jgi:hypothetical protein
VWGGHSCPPLLILMSNSEDLESSVSLVGMKELRSAESKTADKSVRPTWTLGHTPAGRQAYFGVVLNRLPCTQSVIPI